GSLTRKTLADGTQIFLAYPALNRPPSVRTYVVAQGLDDDLMAHHPNASHTLLGVTHTWPQADAGGVARTPATVESDVAAPAHVVQKGDTLQSLALRYYGTRSEWGKIYAANRTILPSKDQLKVGQQLVIP